MLILFNNESFENCLEISKLKTLKKFYDIIYNESNKILLSKRYITYLEQSVPNIELFQALLIELQDNNRLVLQQTSLASNVDEEFFEIYKNNNEAFLFTLIFENNTILNVNIEKNAIIKVTALRSKIIDELLTKGGYTACYQDFKTDKDVSLFFDELFSIPRYIKEANIFDREVNSLFLKALKGSNICYYTLFKRGTHFLDKKDAKTELRKNLGGKLKLYATQNYRLLHERKIIIENLIITIDNSFNNLTIKEPTWEITIGNNSTKAKSWKIKCKDFYEVN